MHLPARSLAAGSGRIALYRLLAELAAEMYLDLINRNALPFKYVVADTIYDDNGNPIDINTNSQNIKQFVIQEKWFFDKQSSVMKVRLYAISPAIYKQEYNPATGRMLPQIEKVPVFVVYFPQCRRLFATNAVYNSGNDAQNISFDDLFFQRRFSSTIVAESNVYGNRFVTDYLKGQDALMEADRIKNDLFIMEHDLWEF